MTSRLVTLFYSLVVLTVTSPALAACGGDPCAELLEKVCAATDDKGCKLYADSVGGKTPSSSQQKACTTVLEDPQTLKATLDLLAKRAGK